MKPPIIVIDEADDVDFYASVEDAEVSMEPVDVADGIFRVYDSEGYSLQIDISTVLHRKKNWFFSRIDTVGSPTLKDFEKREKNEEELISILKLFCEKNSIPIDDYSSLSDILNAVKKSGRIMPPGINRK